MTEPTTAEFEPASSDHQPTLGPDTLLWRYAGDSRIYLLATTAGLLQNMLPGVSAGIEQHSEFFSEPWTRTMRSIPQIMETVYDDEVAHMVRDYHHTVKGVDHHGQRYHALSPELYTAAHAVFVYTILTVIDVFDHPLTDAEKHQLYQETKLWYQRYGVSDRCLPDDWDAFKGYWEDLCTHGFEATPVARAIVDDIYPKGAMTPRPKGFPPGLAPLLRPLIAHQAMLLTKALLPPACRQTMGLDYTRLDRLQFEAQAALVRWIWPLLPDRLQQTPRMRHGKRRALQMASHRSDPRDQGTDYCPFGESRS
jgi:uncharacterized protein (DUF2236 family)